MYNTGKLWYKESWCLAHFSTRSQISGDSHTVTWFVLAGKQRAIRYISSDIRYSIWSYFSGVLSRNILLQNMPLFRHSCRQQRLADWMRLRSRNGDCIAHTANIFWEGNERPPLRCIAWQNKRTRFLILQAVCEALYSWGAYGHNCVKWPERESDHRPLYNVELTCGGYNSIPLHECTKHLNGRSANQLRCVCTSGS